MCLGGCRIILGPKVSKKLLTDTRAEIQEKQGDKIAPLASPHEIELIVWLMTTAHGGVAVDEGVDIHFPAIGLAVLEHTYSPQTVECQPQVAHVFGVFTQHGCGIRTATGGRGEPGGMGHRDTTPGGFVAVRLAIPLVVKKPG